ncbi:MAG: site-2 protease family protein, partial [Phycisphaerales bacterium]|nr:site-2 protease family protein [Phycisphaerales bacterium]
PLPNEPRAEVPVARGAPDVRALQAMGWRVDLNERMFKDVSVVVRADGPLEAIGMGFSHTKKLMVQTYLTIDRLLRGSVGIEQLRGPVGIVHIGTIVAEKGLMYLILLLAIISVNLAVLNFLPLPIVDGGLFLFLVYEKFKGRPPSVAFQNAATLAGLFLLVGLFLVVTYNDIMRLIS